MSFRPCEYKAEKRRADALKIHGLNLIFFLARVFFHTYQTIYFFFLLVV